MINKLQIVASNECSHSLKEVQLQKVEDLLSRSEAIEAMLEDGELINATDKAYFRESNPNGSHSMIYGQGRFDKGNNGLIALAIDSTIQVEILLELELRPINDAAKSLYHSLFAKRLEYFGRLQLSNLDCSAIIEIIKSQDGILKVKLFNSMEDETKNLDFDSVEAVFEEFMFSFYCLLTKSEFGDLLQEFKLIADERRARPNILTSHTFLEVV